MDERLNNTKMGEIVRIVENTVEDYIKATGGVKSAGTRVRKNMMDLKNLAMQIRKDILESRQKK